MILESTHRFEMLLLFFVCISLNRCYIVSYETRKFKDSITVALNSQIVSDSTLLKWLKFKLYKDIEIHLIQASNFLNVHSFSYFHSCQLCIKVSLPHTFITIFSIITVKHEIESRCCYNFHFSDY